MRREAALPPQQPESHRDPKCEADVYADDCDCRRPQEVKDAS